MHNLKFTVQVPYSVKPYFFGNLFFAKAAAGYREAGRDAGHNRHATHLQDWLRRHRRRHRAQAGRDGSTQSKGATSMRVLFIITRSIRHGTFGA